MSEAAITPQAPAQQAPATQAPAQAQPEAKPFEAITSQEQLDKLLGDRLSRERAKFADYGDLKAKAEKFDAAAEAAKTDLQRTTERAEKAERELAEAAAARLRFEVAAEKGLTAKQAARLIGTTREELTADADQLLAEFTPATTPQVGLRINQPQGTPDPSNTESAARAFFGL